MEVIAEAAAAYFKYKTVTSIIVLVCWPAVDQHRFLSQLWTHDVMAVTRCPEHPDPLNVSPSEHTNLGVLYFNTGDNDALRKLDRYPFSIHYKWLIVGNYAPSALDSVRYDAEMTLLMHGTTADYQNDTESDKWVGQRTKETTNLRLDNIPKEELKLKDIYVRPVGGTSTHPWGSWTTSAGLVVLHETARIRRRLDLMGFPIKVATPMGSFRPDTYKGDFYQYLADEGSLDIDAATRCSHSFVALLLESLNITEILHGTLHWIAAEPSSDSTARMLIDRKAEISGSVLRLLVDRIPLYDYITALWPLRIGFTYVGARESDTNMFAAPFSTGVWCACAASAVLLAVALRLASRGQSERDGAIYSAIATCLQQDASVVPERASGRAVFIVLSVCSMIIYSYYTSAVVSSLLDGGRGTPPSLRYIADSSLKAASEDINYSRYLFFEVETTWDDLEYLKKKKKTASFYQSLERGVELVRDGAWAYHTEYNGIYRHLAQSLPDSALCRLRYVDTVPEIKTYILAQKNGEYTSVLKPRSHWLHEVGISGRLLTKWRNLHPACRAAVLAESVNLADVAPLLVVMAVGTTAALLLLAFELAFDRHRVKLCATRTARIATQNQ